MTSKVPLVLMLVFSFVLSFGVVDPVFGVRASYGLVDLLAVLMVISCLAFNAKSLVRGFDKSSVYLCFLLVFLFGSSVMYGDAVYDKEIFNFKLLICIVIYISLLSIYKSDTSYIYYSLLSYSLGVFVFVLLLNTIYSHGVVSHNGRLIVFDENPNSTSARFTIAVIFLAYIAIKDPFSVRVLRVAALVMSLPIIYMILQSGSRGSVLSMMFSLFLLLYFSGARMSLKIFATIAISLLFPYIMIIIASAGSIYERLVSSFQGGDLAGRDFIWSGALDIISKNLLFGVGEPGYFDEINKITGLYVDTHNILLYILAAGGVVSLLFFLLFYKALFLKAFRVFRHREALPMVLLANVTLISLKTGGALTYVIMWFVFAMIAALPRNPAVSPSQG